MKDWIRLVSVNDCPVGRGRFVQAGEHELAVFHLDDPDRFIVTRNSCPHAGGNLAAGDIEGNVVTCPWHQWAFDLDRGMCMLSDSARLQTYESRVKGGWVWVRILV